MLAGTTLMAIGLLAPSTRLLPRLAVGAPRSTVVLNGAAVPPQWRGPSSPPPPVDLARLAVYPAATGVEWALIAGLFAAVDAIGPLPGFVVPPLFLFLSLRSRIFSPLSASRPDRSAQGGGPTPLSVKRPWWTPPGIAFPFIWITISFLRASSSFLVWQAGGRVLASPTLLALVAHLCVGDTWNCITNVERRLGTSAVGVLAVLSSVLYAVAAYAKAAPLAGKLLAPSAAWIMIASVLTWTIWAINKPRQSLLPRIGDKKNAALQLPLSKLLQK